jgi:hypothetical protein
MTKQARQLRRIRQMIGGNVRGSSGGGGTGPAGPQGPVGPQGPAGPQGEQGPAGTDQWTYVRLTSDFTTSSSSAVDVTGLAFTPAANGRYEFYGRFLLRTATATVGPRPGLAWPTGMSDGVATFYTPSSATATLNTHGNISAAILVAVGGLPTTTASWQGTLQGLVIAGASPSGTVQIRLASETAGTNVTMKAGSFIAYRSIP